MDTTSDFDQLLEGLDDQAIGGETVEFRPQQAYAAQPAQGAIAESWKPIPGFESCYEVSNMGGIWALASDCKAHLWNSRNGGMYVKLYSGGVETMPQVHILVATSFVANPNPTRNTYVKHLNGNKKDNRAENLVWAHKSELISMLRGRAVVDQSPPKLTHDEVAEIRVGIDAGIPMRTLAREYNTGICNIRTIARGDSWRSNDWWQQAND